MLKWIPESPPRPSENVRSGAPAQEAAWRDALGFEMHAGQESAGGMRASARIASSQWRNAQEWWYPDALGRLKKINEEAVDQDYPTVGEGAKAEAARLLRAMRTIPWEPAIYPSMDGEIAIYFKSPRATAALLILLDDSRQAACYWSTDAENTRKRYEDVSELPDEFLIAKIRTLIRPALLQTDPKFFRRAGRAFV